MFTLDEWDILCEKISDQENVITINEILNQPLESRWVAIKHDIETNVDKALKVARIEAHHNIKATYYFQADLVDDNFHIMEQIADLGHEVTYHYDVLDSNKGDYELAIKSFNDNLKKFERYGFKVQTVCPHGNPIMIRNGWTSNKDFFRHEKVQSLFPKILDMVVQLPTKLKKNYLYISDAGFGWKQIVNIDSNDIISEGDIKLNGNKEVINKIQSRQSLIIVLILPMESNILIYYLNYFTFKVLRLFTMIISKVPPIKMILSKYYFLAKRI